MSLIFIGQVFGIFSFVLGVFTFTHKNDVRLKQTMCLLFLCQTVHFFCFGSATGVVVNFLSFIRTLVALKWHGRYIGAIFIALNIVWGAFNVASTIDVLPILAASIGTFAIFYLSGIQMRLAFMCGATLWLINNWFLGSIGGVLLESLVFCANAWTIVRLKNNPNDETKKAADL